MRSPRSVEDPPRSSGLVSAFSSLVSAQLVTAAAGFVFWLLTARLAEPAHLGVAAAAISVAALLSKLFSVGLGTLLIGELPKLSARGARHLLRVSAAALAVIAGLGALAFAVPAAALSTLSHLRGPVIEAMSSPALVVSFVVLTITTTLATVFDQAVLGLGRAGTQITRNVIASLGRFPVVAVFVVVGNLDTLALLMCWVVPLAVSLVVSAFQIGLGLGLRDAGHPRAMRLALSHWREALRHHALNLALASGPLMVPVVAGAALTSVGNAHFTIAWMVATFVFVPPYMLATALFSSSVNQGVARFATSMRRTLPASLGMSGLLCLGTWLAGGLAMQAFGPEYADNSVHLLNLLVLAGLWMVFKDHIVALYRVEHRLSLATKLAMGSLVIETSGTVLGAYVAGSTGLVVGWLLSCVVQAVLVLPILVRLLRLARSAPRADRGAPVLVTNGVVDDPVEGGQVLAGQVAAHLTAEHDGRLITAAAGRPVNGVVCEPRYRSSWIPLLTLVAVARKRPGWIVFLPDGGLNYKTLLHAVLLGLACRRRPQMIVLQRGQDVPRWLGRIAGRFTDVLAINEADRGALESSGFRAGLWLPGVDPRRISDLGSELARDHLGLPHDERIYLHVGHARPGRNLRALAPLAEPGTRLLLVISPFSDIVPGALVTGPNIDVVHRKVDVSLYYRAADVYVFPTTDRLNVIGSPLSIGEAIGNGLPVVARSSPMTARWADRLEVHLVETDDELVEVARIVSRVQDRQSAGDLDPSLPSTCCPGCASASPSSALRATSKSTAS